VGRVIFHPQQRINTDGYIYISFAKLHMQVKPQTQLMTNINNKLAPYGTDGQLFATDVSAKFKVT